MANTEHYPFKSGTNIEMRKCSSVSLDKNPTEFKGHHGNIYPGEKLK